jgi:hypothetical protein
MKILLNTVLILSALTELLAAATLIGGPAGLSAAGSGEMWSMHFAALAIASLSAWVWPRRSDLAALTVALSTLLVFHTGLTVSLAAAGDQPVGLVIHAVLATLCAILFIRRAAVAV